MTTKRDDDFLTYQFMARVSLPFEKWPAYSLKLIDKNGNLLRQPKTQKEKEAWGKFDVICNNIKKTIKNYPALATQMIAVKSAPFQLNVQTPSSPQVLPTQAATNFLVREDAPANCVGGGAIASTGVGPAGEPPGIPRKKKNKTRLKHIRRIVGQ